MCDEDEWKVQKKLSTNQHHPHDLIMNQKKERKKKHPVWQFHTKEDMASVKKSKEKS